MLDLMKGNTTMRIGEILLKLGGFAGGLVFALLGTFRDLFAAADTTEESDRSIQNSDLIGDYNFRTQQFDSGTDPAGWYEDEP